MTREDYEALIIAREHRNWNMPIVLDTAFHPSFCDSYKNRAAYIEFKHIPDEIIAGTARRLSDDAVLWSDHVGCYMRLERKDYNRTWRLWHIVPDEEMKKYIWQE